MNTRRSHLPSSMGRVVLFAALEMSSANGQPSARHAPAHWAPVSAAITTTGELRRDMFSQIALHIIDANLTRNSIRVTACIGPTSNEEFFDFGSLDGLISNSLTILRRRIRSSETGFYDGRPGTLYALQPGPLLKHYGRLDAQSSLFLFIPEALIHTSKGTICARALSEVPAPVVDDEVVAFVSLDPIDANHSVLQVDANKQLAVVHERQFFYPAGMAVSRDQSKRAFLTMDELESEVRQNTHINDFPARGAR